MRILAIRRWCRISDEELRKLHTAVHFGADTVMDLSTRGDIPMIREAILRHSPVPIGTVPLYEALSRVKRVEDLNIDLYLEVIEESGAAGAWITLRFTRVCWIQYIPMVAKAHYWNCRAAAARLPGAVDDASPQAELPVREL